MAHRTCSVPGCGKSVVARGWCTKHYQRWRKAADPSEVRRRQPSTGRRSTPQGYVYIWKPDHPLAHADGYVPEHRMVAWDAGILTDPRMDVHHIDHNKANNDLSNLAPMTRSEHIARHIEEDGVENQYGRFGRISAVCSVAGCDRRARTSDLCSAHYSRLVRWGTVRADLPVVPGQKLTTPKPCASPVCDRPAASLGWCNGHYNRLKATGDAKPDRPIGKPGRPPKSAA